MAKIPCFNHIIVHDGYVCRYAQPSQGRNQQFSKIASDAASADDGQFFWGPLSVHED
jgi:hypothetical protein